MDDIAIIITIILGFATCISPPLVAIINNYHNRKIEQLRLNASAEAKSMELKIALQQKQLDLMFDKKYSCFQNFLVCGSRFISHYDDMDCYSDLVSAYSQAIMHGISWSVLKPVIDYASAAYANNSMDQHTQEQLQAFLHSAGEEFKKSLTDTRSLL